MYKNQRKVFHQSYAKDNLHAQMVSTSLETGKTTGQFGVGVINGCRGLKGISGKRVLNTKKKAVTLRW